MGKKEKITLVALGVIALGSLVWSVINFVYANTKPAPTFGGTYIEGMVGQPAYINPLLAHQETDYALIKLVYSALYDYDEQGTLKPELAAGMPVISEDQKQYTIELRKDVLWHNEKPFTADDVIFTIQAIKDPAYHSPLRLEWQSTNVEKLGDYTVRFTTKDISGPFLSNLRLPILPKGIWGRLDAQNVALSQNNLEAIGTGPYQIKEIKKLASGKIQQITLESFSRHLPRRAFIDQLVIKFYDTDQDLLNAFHSKEIHGLSYIPNDSNVNLDQRRNNISLLTARIPHYQVVFFNLAQPILADVKVRRALFLASDRRTLVEKIFKGQAFLPNSPLVFTSQQAASSLLLDGNMEQAKTLLDQAGWKIDTTTGLRSKKGQVLELTLSTNDVSFNSKAAETLAEQWRALGIKINLNVLPTKQLTDQEIRPRTFHILLFNQRFNDDPDPFAFWHSSQTRDPGLNLTGFANQQADKLITEARSTTNRQTREQKYAEFNQLFADEMPAFFLTQSQYIYAVDKDIKNTHLGVLYEASDRFNTITEWYIAEKRVWE